MVSYGFYVQLDHSPNFLISFEKAKQMQQAPFTTATISAATLREICSLLKNFLYFHSKFSVLVILNLYLKINFRK